MGFRRPLTTATAVDTSAGSGSGARITVQPIVVNQMAGATVPATAMYLADPTAAPGLIYVTDQLPAGLNILGRALVLDSPGGQGQVVLADHDSFYGAARLDVGNAVISGAADPIYAQDVATKNYADHTAEIIEPAAGSYATGWAPLAAGGYQGLQFVRSRDGIVTVSGVLKYNGGTGAGLTMFTLSGVYRPRGLQSHIVHGNVADTFRDIDVTATALLLRGALPTVGQFVSINGTYPGTLVT